MDIPIELVIVAIVLVFIMSIMVMGTEYTIPMYERGRFDDICSNYLAAIQRDGGLNSEQKESLRTELANIGITNITIDAPAQSNWGEEIALRIEGDYVFKTTDYSNMTKQDQTKHIVYQNKTIALNLGSQE